MSDEKKAKPPGCLSIIVLYLMAAFAIAYCGTQIAIVRHNIEELDKCVQLICLQERLPKPDTKQLRDPIEFIMEAYREIKNK